MPPAPKLAPVAVQPKLPCDVRARQSAWTRQIGGVLRLELKKTFLSKRGWWIYFLALGPVLLTLIHWLFESRRTAAATAWAKTA